MKVAVCYSGQPRVVEKGYKQYMEKFLYKCNPDFEFYNFFHMWFDLEDINEKYINAGGHEASEPIPPDVIQKIITFYDPTKMWVEKQVLFDEKDYNEHKYPAIIPFFSLSKMNSILRANQLKSLYENENSMKFDIVISNRTDIAPEFPINLHDYDFGAAAFYYPRGCPHPESVNVIFGMGNSAVMDYYSEMVRYVDHYWRDVGIPFCDEPFAYYHLVKEGIAPIEMSNQFSLLRK